MGFGRGKGSGAGEGGGEGAGGGNGKGDSAGVLAGSAIATCCIVFMDVIGVPMFFAGIALTTVFTEYEVEVFYDVGVALIVISVLMLVGSIILVLLVCCIGGTDEVEPAPMVIISNAGGPQMQQGVYPAGYGPPQPSYGVQATMAPPVQQYDHPPQYGQQQQHAGHIQYGNQPQQIGHGQQNPNPPQYAGPTSSTGVAPQNSADSPTEIQDEDTSQPGQPVY